MCVCVWWLVEAPHELAVNIPMGSLRSFGSVVRSFASPLCTLSAHILEWDCVLHVIIRCVHLNYVSQQKLCRLKYFGVCLWMNSVGLKRIVLCGACTVGFCHFCIVSLLCCHCSHLYICKHSNDMSLPSRGPTYFCRCFAWIKSNFSDASELLWAARKVFGF